MREDPKDRLLRQTKPAGACLEWNGYRDKWGYGNFWFNGKNTFAHRSSWIIHFGEIHNSKQVLHKCDNPPCINPAHLFLGSHADNMRDKLQKGRIKKFFGKDHWNYKHGRYCSRH